MNSETNFGGNVFEKATDFGNKFADHSGKIGLIGLSALKKTLHSQLELTSAVVALGAGQFGSLASVGKPAVFLQRQKELGETLTEKLHGYVENLREIGVETQSACTALAQDIGADLGLKAV